MPSLKDESPQQYAASNSITTSHVEPIITQSMMMKQSEPQIEDMKKHQQKLKLKATSLFHLFFITLKSAYEVKIKFVLFERTLEMIKELHL